MTKRQIKKQIKLYCKKTMQKDKKLKMPALQKLDVIKVNFNDFLIIYSNYDSDGIVTFITKDNYYLKDVY